MRPLTVAADANADLGRSVKRGLRERIPDRSLITTNHWCRTRYGKWLGEGFPDLRRYSAGSFRRGETPVDAVSTSSLDVQIQAPTTVQIGYVLRYRVTLTNRTSVSVSLRSCPGFVERVEVNIGKTFTRVGFRGKLNCADAPQSLRSGQSVILEFDLDVIGVPTGQGNLTWQLLRGDQVANAREVFLTVTK